MMDNPGKKLQRAAFIINIVNIIVTVVSAITLYVLALKNSDDVGDAFLAFVIIFIYIAISVFLVYMECLLWSAIGEISKKSALIAELQGYELYLKIKDNPSLQAELQNKFRVASVLSTIVNE